MTVEILQSNYYNHQDSRPGIPKPWAAAHYQAMAYSELGLGWHILMSNSTCQAAGWRAGTHEAQLVQVELCTRVCVHASPGLARSGSPLPCHWAKLQRLGTSVVDNTPTLVLSEKANPFSLWDDLKIHFIPNEWPS